MSHVVMEKRIPDLSGRMPGLNSIMFEPRYDRKGEVLAEFDLVGLMTIVQCGDLRYFEGINVELQDEDSVNLWKRKEKEALRKVGDNKTQLVYRIQPDKDTSDIARFFNNGHHFDNMENEPRGMVVFAIEELRVRSQ